ncbi:MAG: sulfatase-like hydrolase/transferase [Planctomycetes bacterium]|nr:sulfatase-like hydrolase/transferase [Planctomycetota bacterium]
MSERPNIIIFNPDSYRGDVLGHLDNPGAHTPNLDALVRNGGVSYANAFSQNPVCTPSRCSFMTGWYPHVHGHRSMKNMLDEHEPHLLPVLQDQGYYVWWGGKNDLVAVEEGSDYLKHCDTKYRPDDCATEYHVPEELPDDNPLRGVFYDGVMTKDGDGSVYHDRDAGHVDGAVDFINRFDGEQPVCLYLPLGLPHPAYRVEEEFYDLIDPNRLPERYPTPENDLNSLNDLREAYGAPRVSEEQWVELRRVYYAMCAKADHLFGRVLEALRRNDMYEDALIIFLSDHGDFAGDYSLPEKTHMSLQDALIQCPFIIKPPASFRAASGVRNHLTELVDMTATVYDLLNIDPGYDSFGLSLLDSLGGDDSEIREAVFAEVGARKGEEAFKNKDVKGMPPESFYSVQSSVALPVHEAGSYAVSCRTHDHKYVRRPYSGDHELFDLNADPGELQNVCGRAEYKEVEQEMERRLLDFFATTADVLPREQDSRRI